MDMSEFYQTFFSEAEELLADIEHNLLALDISSPYREQLNAIFRYATRSKAVRERSVLLPYRRRPICWKTCWIRREAASYS